MSQLSEYLSKFFFVFLRGRTYLNMLYLFLTFPLGIIYFVVLITLFSLGVPLILVWVGLLILLGMFGLWYLFVVFERKLAIWLLKEDIGPVNKIDLNGMNLWAKFKATAGNPVTWKGLAFLLMKLPLGTINFSILVTLLSISLSLLATPLYYRWVQPRFDFTWSTVPMHWSYVDTLPEALLLALLGLFMLLISMHIFNGMAYVSGKLAKVMLGNSTAGAIPTEKAPAIQPIEPELPAV